MRKNDLLGFFRGIDPTITTYEAEKLFLLTDKDKNGFISLNEFNEIFCETDYRSVNDIVSRRIQ